MKTTGRRQSENVKTDFETKPFGSMGQIIDPSMPEAVRGPSRSAFTSGNTVVDSVDEAMRQINFSRRRRADGDMVSNTREPGFTYRRRGPGDKGLDYGGQTNDSEFNSVNGRGAKKGRLRGKR